MASDFQVVEHLAEFMIRDAVDDLGIDNDKAEHDQVRDVFPNPHAFVNHIITRLLDVGNATQAELHAERILVGFLHKTVSQGIQNLECATDDSTRLTLVSQSVFIRVHPWLDFFIRG